MDLAPLAWFAVGRVVFGLIERWSWRFVWFELGSTVLFLLGAAALRDIADAALQGLLVGGIFLLTAVGARVLARRHPVEAEDPGEPGRGQVVAVGIIDFAWLAVLGGTLAILCFARASYPFSTALPMGNLPTPYVESELSNSRFLLEKTIDCVFLLGGVLSGCMAILWAGEIWRQRDATSRKQYRFTTVAAIRMVVAYFVVVVAAFYWVGVPLYRRAAGLTLLLRNP